jgi:hypothetical protein
MFLMEPVDSPQNSQEPQAVVIRKEPEKDLYVWTAPSRPFKQRDRQFYVTTFAITGIVSLILLFAEGMMPVLLIISLVFLYYVLSTVEPEKIEYKITNKGVKIAGRLTEWNFLNRFWFTRKLDTDLLVIETSLIPGRMEMVIKEGDKTSIKHEVSAFIPYEEVPNSGLDKATDWLSSKLPGNK